MKRGFRFTKGLAEKNNPSKERLAGDESAGRIYASTYWRVTSRNLMRQGSDLDRLHELRLFLAQHPLEFPSCRVFCRRHRSPTSTSDDTILREWGGAAIIIGWQLRCGVERHIIISKGKSLGDERLARVEPERHLHKRRTLLARPVLKHSAQGGGSLPSALKRGAPRRG